MLTIYNYNVYFTISVSKYFDYLGISRYKVIELIEQHWDDRKIESKRKDKYFVLCRYGGKYMKIRFKIYEEESKLLVIAAEIFTKVRK